ncbi:MAG: PIN domain-containing protein [Acidimicrobiales bacterium]
MTAVLDAGALIAIDKRDRRVGAMLRVLQHGGVPIYTSAAVVAQVWRDGRRQANLARVLSGVDVAPLDDHGGRRVGELLRASKSNDLVDAHVALLVQPEARVLTSDGADIQALLRSRRVKAHVVRL